MAIMLITACPLLFKGTTVMETHAQTLDTIADTQQKIDSFFENSEFERLYYVTDNEDAYMLENYLLSNGKIKYCNTTILRETDTPKKDIWEYFSEKIVDRSIIYDNAYVIVEFKKLPKEKNVTSIFNNYFPELKQNNCKVMFICGTDESYISNYPSYTDFLDYVDIHINTDLKYIFFLNIYWRLLGYGEREKIEFCNVTFFLNSCFSQNDEYIEYYFYDFFKDFFKEDEERIVMQGGLKNYLLNRRIYLIGQFDGGFIEILSGTVINDENMDDYVYNEQVCAIAEDNGAIDDWQNLINNIRETWGLDKLPSYIFGGYYEDLYGEIYFCTIEDYTYVIEAFLADANLKPFDNWEGRCKVTHKAITFGEEGWMLVPSDIGLDVHIYLYD